MGAPQPSAATTPPRAPQRGGQGATVAHSDKRQLCPPSPAPPQGFCGLSLPGERHSGVPRRGRSQPLQRPTMGFLKIPLRLALPTVDYRMQLDDRVRSAQCGHRMGACVEPLVYDDTPTWDPGSTVNGGPARGVGTTHPTTTHVKSWGRP